MGRRRENLWSDVRRVAGAVSMPRTPHLSRSRPPTAQGEYLDLPARGRIFARLADGPANSLPVLLLHGWSWNADLNYADAIGPLARHHRVIAPDALSHGRGLRPAGPWRLRDATDDAVALLDLLGIERAIFCGFSLGGVMTADALVRHYQAQGSST